MTDEPRRLEPSSAPSDRLFRGGAVTIGLVVLAITASIGVFLAWKSVPTLRHYGLHFFTESQWLPDQDIIGISAVLLGTVTVAIIALIFAFPLALCTALFISEYAPPKARSLLISLIDLMAAVPSIVFGLLGRDFLQTQLLFVAHW